MSTRSVFQLSERQVYPQCYSMSIYDQCSVLPHHKLTWKIIIRSTENPWNSVNEKSTKLPTTHTHYFTYAYTHSQFHTHTHTHTKHTYKHPHTHTKETLEVKTANQIPLTLCVHTATPHSPHPLLPKPQISSAIPRYIGILCTMPTLLICPHLRRRTWVNSWIDRYTVDWNTWKAKTRLW